MKKYDESFTTWLKENGFRKDRRYYSTSQWNQLFSEYERFKEATLKLSRNK